MTIESKYSNYTIRQVADICNVLPRQASQWFDSGRLRGFRIPGTQERRVPRNHLLTFMREHHMDDELSETNCLEESEVVKVLAKRREERELDNPESRASERIAELHAMLEKQKQLTDEQFRKAKAFEDAINRSGFDVSPCMHCGMPVVCLPDGMPCCEECAGEADR